MTLGMPLGWAYTSCLTVYAGLGFVNLIWPTFDTLIWPTPWSTIFLVPVRAERGGPL